MKKSLKAVLFSILGAGIISLPLAIGQNADAASADFNVNFDLVNGFTVDFTYNNMLNGDNKSVLTDSETIGTVNGGTIYLGTIGVLNANGNFDESFKGIDETERLYVLHNGLNLEVQTNSTDTIDYSIDSTSGYLVFSDALTPLSAYSDGTFNLVGSGLVVGDTCTNDFDLGVKRTTAMSSGAYSDTITLTVTQN